MKKLIIPFLFVLSTGAFGQMNLKETAIASDSLTTSTQQLLASEAKLLTDSKVVAYTLPSNNRIFLRGVIKTVGVGMLTYQINNLNANGKGNATNGFTTKRLVPAIGLGLAIGLPDMVKGIRNIKHTKRFNSQDFLIQKQRIVTSVTEKSAPANFKGSMASTMDLQSFGDCLGGGDDDGGSYTYEDVQGSGVCVDIYVRDVQSCISAYNNCTTGCNTAFPFMDPLSILLKATCKALCELAQIRCGSTAYSSYLQCRRN